MLAYCSQDSAQCPLVVQRGKGRVLPEGWNSWLVKRDWVPQNPWRCSQNQIWSSGTRAMEAGDRTVLMHSPRSKTRSLPPDWRTHSRMHRPSKRSARKAWITVIDSHTSTMLRDLLPGRERQDSNHHSVEPLPSSTEALQSARGHAWTPGVCL